MLIFGCYSCCLPVKSAVARQKQHVYNVVMDGKLLYWLGSLLALVTLILSWLPPPFFSDLSARSKSVIWFTCGLLIVVCFITPFVMRSEDAKPIADIPKPVPTPPPAATPAHTFDISDGVKLSTPGATIYGKPPAGLLLARGNATADFSKLVTIDPSGPLTFPDPDGKYSQASNSFLRAHAKLLVHNLYGLHNEFEKATANKTGRIAEISRVNDAASKVKDRGYQSIVLDCRSVATEIANRPHTWTMPFSREIYLGFEAIVLQHNSGVDAELNAGKFLDYIADGLSN